MDFSRLLNLFLLLIVLVFLIWCGTITIAQIDERLEKNSTTSIDPRLSTTVGSRFAANQSTLLHYSTIRATSTVGYSNISVNTSTVLPPSQGPKRKDYSKLAFIIVGIAIVVILFVAISLILYKRKKREHCRHGNAYVQNTYNCAKDDYQYGSYYTSEEDDEEGSQSSHVAAEYLSLPEIKNIRLPSVCPSLSFGLSAWGIEEPCSPSFYNIMAEEEDFIPMSGLKEGRSKTVSKRAGLVKKIITTAGGEIRLDDITLNVGAGCLAKDTEITLIKDDQNFAFKSLHDLGLVDAAPRVVEFLPDGLKFLKPADLTIRSVEKTISADSELFIFHGSYNRDSQRIVWNLVTNNIENSRAKGVVKVKINGFCFYSFLMAGHGKIARLLSHLNNSFSCCAYVLYRRLPTMNTIDISVVFVSKFVDEVKKEDIEQLKILYEAGYIRGEKGVFKTVHTDRRLELNLEFPGVSPAPISVKVENAELDIHGFVVDQFKGIPVKKTASGMVRIKEVYQNGENELLWLLNVREIISEIVESEQAIEQFTELDPKPPVVYRNTKLTNSEISRVSRCVGVDWDSLAGLLDIPYFVREEIRSNDRKYPDSYSKAEQILERFNGRPDFCRHILKKCVEELDREDLKDELHPVENEVEDETEKLIPESELSPYENVQLRRTPLSAREMFRLSRRIRVDWDSLAGLMDIAKEERNDIRYNTMYKDHRHRAEKILSLYNRKRDFSRQKLAEYFKGICKDELIKPIMTGQWRNLIVRNS